VLQSEHKSSGLAEITTKEGAFAFCSRMCDEQHIYRAQKPPEGESALSVVRPDKNQFTLESGTRYTWMYQGKKGFSNFLTGALIVAFLACTCFPIWPKEAKVGVWYCSVTFLIIFFIISVIRALVFVIAWLFGWDFWILPRMFDDNLGFFESFVPLYSLSKDENESPTLRVFTVCVFVAFTGWIYTQPTDFDGFLMAGRSFTEDLYEGKLLPDREAEAKQREEEALAKIPKIADLLKEDDEEGAAKAAKDAKDTAPEVDEHAEEEKKNEARLNKMVEEQSVMSEEEKAEAAAEAAMDAAADAAEEAEGGGGGGGKDEGEEKKEEL